MRDQFLAAVQKGSVKAVRTLIKNNSSNFNISYYIRCGIPKSKKIVNGNVLQINSDLSHVDPEIKGVILTHQEINLDEKKSAGIIDFLRKHNTSSMRELVYITWFYLDETKLDRNTLNASLLMAAAKRDEQILQLLLFGGFAKAEPIVLKGSANKLNANELFKKHFKCPIYQFNYLRADPDAKNEQGQSALQLAAQSRSEGCVALLLRRGATIPKDDESTTNFCKDVLANLLKCCWEDEKLKLKIRFEKNFPELFPPPRWYALLLYAQRLASNLMRYRFIAPMLSKLMQTLGYSPRNVITNLALTAGAIVPDQLADSSKTSTAAEGKTDSSRPVQKISISLDKKRRASI